MRLQKRFDPIETSRKIETAYRDYLTTTIRFDDERYQAQLTELLATPRHLAKGPYLEMAWPYRASCSLRDLVREGVLCESMLSLGDIDPDRKLYVHQERAIRKAAEGRNYIVVTGTGSGKTECFLLPILNDILAEFERDGASPGIRAILLYPMNALANDQLKRLRSMLAGTPITFGRYTGETADSLNGRHGALEKWWKENPGVERMKNELISREEMRKTPPNILLTNYSMLEYMLLRPTDARLFGSAFGGSWRHLSIDEAHVYSGSLGSEIALLIRRLKARVETEIGRPLDLHCYATSATIGTDSAEDLSRVASFAQDLFGEPFSADPQRDMDVITSERDLPSSVVAEHASWTMPLKVWERLNDLLPTMDGEFAQPDDLASALEGVAPEEGVAHVRAAAPADLPLALGKLLLCEGSTISLVRYATENDLLDLTGDEDIASIGIEGIGSGRGAYKTLAHIVEVLSFAQRSSGVPILSARYHAFLRAPEGLFLNLSTNQLTDKKGITGASSMGSYSVPQYEVSICRHCGEAYLLGHESNPVAGMGACAWLDPQHEGTDTLDEDFEPREYYRMLDAEHVESDKDSQEKLVWLCPECGSLSAERDGGGHRFEHPVVPRIPLGGGGTAREDDARCYHCGYQNRYAIQPMRVSPEAAGSVVCYELVRAVPPFDDGRNKEAEKSGVVEASPKTDEIDFDTELDGDFDFDIDLDFDDDDDAVSIGGVAPEDDSNEGSRSGSVICFSDRRQDAAFFAPAFERTYDRITTRQLIRQAIEDLAGRDGTCTMKDLVRWFCERDRASFGNGFATFREESDVARRDMAAAWVLDELMPEDSRNSLAGLGVVSVQPKAYLTFMAGQKGKKYLDKVRSQISMMTGLPWTADDVSVMLRRCLESLRERGALNRTSAQFRYQLSRTGTRPISLDPVKASDKCIAFAGTPAAPNLRREFLKRYVAAHFDTELSGEMATKVLAAFHKVLIVILDGQLKKITGRSYVTKVDGGYLISPALWEFSLGDDEDPGFLCDTCGCETHYDTGGVCPTRKCMGALEPITPQGNVSKDQFYKRTYTEQAHPIRIEEHTAQLSSDEARTIQQDFVDGKVNVLSCTTTFELGVDVGDLRAVFLRDVPPSPANYAQRAGRTGRRAGMPGFAVTFARLRPHDLTHYRKPSSIIKGEILPPSCYLSNATIALRHVFAVALSQYFRDAEQGQEYADTFDSFLSLKDRNPEGIDLLSEYLAAKPESISRQLERVLPKEAIANGRADRVQLDDWGWVDALLNKESGRLVNAHLRQRDDYMRLQESIDQAVAEGNPTKALVKQKVQNAIKNENTISVLAENGVLPKYGFPTDLVTLRLDEDESKAEGKRIDLSRGMSTAIREYAPGSEIVAHKQVWRSVGFRKMPDKPLELRRYGTCEHCGAFAWAIDTDDELVECPVCHEEVYLGHRLIVPVDGFEGERVRDRRAGERRPRNMGYVSAKFWQKWEDDTEEGVELFVGGTITTRASANGRIVLLNYGPSASGFNVCLSCGAAQPQTGGRGSWPKRGYCKHEHPQHIHALGTDFVSDVLELKIQFSSPSAAAQFGDDDWLSARWAIANAAAQVLEVPGAELGVTELEGYVPNGRALLIYDSVPGGAGRAFQLKRLLRDVLEQAYALVDKDCCSEDSCCYSCLCNYFNQPVHARMTRGGARRVLAQLMMGAADGAPVVSTPVERVERKETMPQSREMHIDPVLEEGYDFSDEGFSRACEAAADIVEDLQVEERAILNKLASWGRRFELDVPLVNVPIAEDIYATLLWPETHVMLLAEADEQFLYKMAGGPCGITDWEVLHLREADLTRIMDLLKGDSEWLA